MSLSQKISYQIFMNIQSMVFFLKKKDFILPFLLHNVKTKPKKKKLILEDMKILEY